MQTSYDVQMKATLVRDEAGRVRAVTHVDTYPIPDGASARDAALAYLRGLRGGFDLDSERLEGATQRLSFLDPQPRGEEFRLREEKATFDTTTVAFNQTYLNLPVWESGVTVTLKQAPWRAVSATDTSAEGIDAKMPSDEAIERFRRLFETAEKSDVPRRREARRRVYTAQDSPNEDARVLGSLLGVEAAADARARHEGEPPPLSLIRGRFYVYRYDPRMRLDSSAQPEGEGAKGEPRVRRAQPLCGTPPPFPVPIPSVPDRIRAEHWYVIAELMFRLPVDRPMNWRALVEVETGAILYLRAQTSAVTANGYVFTYDPITSSGDPANSAAQTALALDALRDDVVLSNLVFGTPQPLTGLRAAVTNIVSPAIAAPTSAVGSNPFYYGSRSSEFTAVNAYYHTERFFQLVESLGFNLASYFDGTTFPVEVDHRGELDGVNAHCYGDGDGIDYTEYGLADYSGTGNPAPEIGIATDWRVVLHELGGHGILYDHVESPFFGIFTNNQGWQNFRVHSLGDSFAMVLNDFESKWHDGFPIDRFLLTPFVPLIQRRSDRDVASGWGWGGTMDQGQYESEEILSTCIFRFYRSIGGDSAYLPRREFSARATAYLMLRAVSTLTPISNPNTPEGILAALIAADAGDWTSEGLAGGAYNKVMTWAFEKQDLGGGVPPAIDVYIDDGRAGEYPYQPVHWANGSMWNRRNPDGIFGHEEPELGSTNYAYCYVKNRGTSAATDVVVNAYHCKPSAGVTWPIDFDAMTTASIAVGAVVGNNGATVQVGPFHWTPTTNAYGHDCMLMIATATGDPSNVDLLSLGEIYADWRLVPNDNNVGQRNVNPVAAGGGLTGIKASLQDKGFWIGNPGRRAATLNVEISLPAVLERAGWRVTIKDFPKDGVRAAPGERRLITFDVHAGRDIPARDIEAAEDRDIVITAIANGAPVGGMAYRLDPALVRPHNDPGDGGSPPVEGGGGPAPGSSGFALPPWLLLLLFLLFLLILVLLILSL